MTRILSLFVLFMLFGVLAFAQNRVVTGTVTDEKGNPVEGASVRVVGTNKGVATDINGNFRIENVAQDAKIQVSGSGIPVKIVDVEAIGGTNISVARTAGQELATVTIGAFGLRKKSESVGYAAGRVDASSITNGKATNLGESLSGRISGLTISNNSSAVNSTPRIVLRGLRSISGDNTALIVLDGVSVPANTINFINPNDVERVDVLKGGQAATLFGSEGVNGAIVITTKKGSRKPELNISTTMNVEKLAYLPRFQHEFGSGSGYGYVPEQNFFPGENQQYGDHYDGSIRTVGRAASDGSLLTSPYSDINNKSGLFETGYTRQSDLSYRAGTDVSSMLLSVQNLNTSGIIPGDKSERTSLRFNTSHNFNKLTLSFDGNYSFTRAKITNSDYYGDIFNVAGWIPINDLRDWRGNKFASPQNFYNDYYTNPYWSLDNNRNLTRQNNFQGNFKFNFQATKALNLSARFGLSNNTSFSTSSNNLLKYGTYAKSQSYLNGFNSDYQAVIVGRGRGVAGQDLPGGIGEGSSNVTRYNIDLLANLKKQFGKVSFDLAAGLPIQMRNSKSVNTSTNALLFDLNTGYNNLTNSFNNLYNGSDNITISRKIGGFADLTLGYDNMFFVHGSFRNDYTSVFSGPAFGFNKPNFQSYGGDVAFVLTNAIPSLKSNVVDNIKIRGSYNRNGNDNLAAYQLQLTYPLGTGFPYSGLAGTSVSNLTPSSTLSPEIVVSQEAGIEVGLFNNRITFEGSVYRQKASKQVLTASISGASGFTQYRVNAAEVKNQGFEIDAKAIAFKSNNLQVVASGNFTYNENEVTKLIGDLKNIEFGENSPHNQASVNATLGAGFPNLRTTAYKRDAAGSIIVDAVTGWPTITTSRVDQGSTLPKYQFGTGLTITFKNITFAANAEYRGGYVVYNGIGEDLAFTGAGALSAIYGRQQFIWPNSVTLDGSGKSLPNTNVATKAYIANYQLGDLSFGSSFNNVGELHVSSGDFWKIRDVSLAYNFPSSLFANSKSIKGASITFFGRNLITILAKDNWYGDPELSTTTSRFDNGVLNANAQGLNDSGNTPSTRQIGGTIKLTF